RKLPLEGILFTLQPEHDTTNLRAIKTLRRINYKSAEEFWKEVDARPPEAWFQRIATLPPKQQVEEVVAKLKERNKGFDGKVPYLPPEGPVAELSFVVDSVKDIAAVRALKGLRTLKCTGSKPGTGQLADLSPLQGMPLTCLHVNKTAVSDLGPLEGMPLTE